MPKICRNKILSILFLSISLFYISCRKFIQIAPPVDSITTSQVYSTAQQATSAMSGVYYKMISNSEDIFNFGISILGGFSSDELILFDQTNEDLLQFQTNNLLSTNNKIDAYWNDAYSFMYSTNAIIEGLQASPINDSVKNELIGEAEFIRGFCNFYLVNLFGPIPSITTVNWHKTSLLSRSPESDIYKSIIADLKDAQTRLPTDYSVGFGQRIIPNKWAATALLARVYLYESQWDSAEAQSTLIINNTSLYSLTELRNVFLINSPEAIWQLQQNNTNCCSYNATPEGYILIPHTVNFISPPFAYLTDSLFNSFEDNDMRKSIWINKVIYNGVQYNYPYKYVIGPDQQTPGGPYTEYYMVLRVAEQYLIRAEARAHLNKTEQGYSDLNIIRNRAGLSKITTTDQNILLNAIYHEMRVEYFSEWGHRWFDLKRTQQSNNVLGIIKSKSWQSTDTLYPIPSSELTTDPNLTQNPGY